MARFAPATVYSVPVIQLDTDLCHRALEARDARFDGVFFVGVTTTGVYCRPVCPARMPRRDRRRFFSCAAAAERDSFRPCLRCRPELAPGLAPVDAGARIARRAAARIDAGALDGPGGLEQLAREFSISSRQLRRVLQDELGVSPVELAQTRRLLLAKQLLTDTRLPMLDVAFAAGFSSLRRFNASFRSHYRLAPRDLRREKPDSAQGETLRLSLAYRPPLDWPRLLKFLDCRVWAGAELIEDNHYTRTVSLGAHRGWVRIGPGRESPSGAAALSVECSESLAPVLAPLLDRLRDLFDLRARPDIIASQLSADPRLAPALRRRPGLRVPGAFDGFETAMRAVLGQQVSVRAATTIAGRLAAALGAPVDTPFPQLSRLSPSAEHIASASVEQIAAVGLPRARAECLRTIASAALDGRLPLAPGADPAAAVEALQELPGIGPWTAGYIAMRVLRWPDAFPAGDLGLRKAVGATTNAQLAKEAESWRPWRAYAAMHLWESLADIPPKAAPPPSTPRVRPRRQPA